MDNDTKEYIDKKFADAQQYQTDKEEAIRAYAKERWRAATKLYIVGICIVVLTLLCSIFFIIL